MVEWITQIVIVGWLARVMQCVAWCVNEWAEMRNN